MAEGQDVQSPAQSPADQPTPEMILRALNLWDDKKTAEQNIAAVRSEGLGGWLDKPREYLERLKPDYKYDDGKTLVENLDHFRQETVDSITTAVGTVAPFVAIYVANKALQQAAPYINNQTMAAAMRNPLSLVSGLSWVQKMRINTALAELATLPEGAALIETLHNSKLPYGMNMNPRTVGGGYVAYESTLLNSSIVSKPTVLGANGFSTHGNLVTVLAHELRHLQQAVDGDMNPFQGKIASPGSAVVYNRFVEADAQATATDIAWKLKEAGNPASWNELHRGQWMEHVAKAYEDIAASDPAALTDGRAKRAAFDAWFVAETPDGVRIADVYNEQGLNSWPRQYLLEQAAHKGAVFAGDLTPEDYARVAGNGGDNYLTRTAGPALDSPYYQHAKMPPIGFATLDAQEATYRQLQERFNAASKPQPRQLELDLGPKPVVEPTPVVDAAPPPDVDAKPAAPPPEQLDLFDTKPAPMSRAAILNNTVDGTMGALGLVQGTMGAIRSAKEGDNWGVAVNGANAVTGGTALGVSIARGLGHEIAPALGTAITKANVVVTVGTGFYQIATEKGNFIDTEADGSHNLGNKGERTVAVVATGVTAFGLAAAGVGSAGVVPAVVAVAVVGDKAIEARRAWKDVDRSIAENGEAQRINRTYAGEDGSPDFRKFKHIFTAVREVSADIKDSELPFKPKRDARGRIAFEDMRKLMETEDPKMLAEFNRALDANIARQQGIMQQYDSILPKWLRFDDTVSQYTDAQMVLADLQGAKTEMGWYQSDIAAWNAAHPQSRFVAGQDKTQAVATTATEKPVVTARANNPAPRA